jgi:hypothetical protein
MSPRRLRIPSPQRRTAASLVVAFALLGNGAHNGAQNSAQSSAQARAAAGRSQEAGDALGQYLEGLRLTRLLGEHLEREIPGAVLPDDRARLVDRLADVYASLLESEDDPVRRDELVQRSSSFLERESPKQADGLRLALLRSRYRAASRVAEDGRAALAEEAKVADVRATLERISAEAGELRKRFELRLRELERRSERTEGLEGDKVQERADVVRGQLQESMGLDAWSRYYRSIVTGERAFAEEAQPIFARLLETGKEYPTPKDVSLDLRSNEFFANTILGMALSMSRTESFVTVSEWLALLDVPQVPSSLRAQLSAWKLVAAMECGEWTAARDIVRSFPADAPAPWLRIAAVGGLRDGRGTKEALGTAREAIALLAARRELGQIADLARRFGEDAIGSRGFAAKYVRGVLAYESARKFADAKNLAEARKTFGEAATLLEEAVHEPDVGEFQAAAGACRSLAGWSHFERGEFKEARALFAEVVESSDGRDEEAEWMALVCVEKLLAGAPAGSEEQAALATEIRQRVDTFIGHHPASARVPQVLLRRTTLTETPRREDLERLLTGSGTSDEVKRQALSGYYRLFRSSTGAERASIGKRFLELSHSMAPTGGPEGKYEGLPAASLVVARQALEISLSVEVDDVPYGAAILDRIDMLAKAGQLDLAPIEHEISVRRVQFSLARNELLPALQRLTALESAGGDEARRSADVARRHIFRYASAALRRGETLGNVDRGALISATLRTGEKLIDQAVAMAGSLEKALDDAAIESVAVTVVQSSAEATQGGGAREVGERGRTLLNTLLERRPKDPVLLDLSATLSMALGDRDAALDALRTLIAGSPERSDRWFKAKVTFIELLAEFDAGRAKAVLQQHRQLHPDLGPEPWGQRLRELERKLLGVEAAPSSGAESAGAGDKDGPRETRKDGGA